MNNIDEVTASRLIFALMRAFSASVAEMPLHRSTDASPQRIASIDLFRRGNLRPQDASLDVPPRLFAHADGAIE